MWWPGVVLVVVFGCGDNLTGTPLEDFDAERARARCDQLVRCGLFTDDATCATFFRKRPDADLVAALAAGVVRYEGVNAKQCNDELAAMSCDTSARDARIRTEACERMFVGTIAAGAQCAFDDECASGSCNIPVCPEACCRGTCRVAHETRAIGAACEIDGDCADDAFCGEDLVCHALVSVGGLCEDDTECEYRLGCIGASELMAGNCRELPLVGEPCPYLRCAELGAVCTAARMCVALGLPGAPCASAADCSPFARCDLAGGVCVDVPTLAMPCTSSCGGEAWCDFAVSGTCEPPKQNGAPCGSDDQCASLDCQQGPAFDSCGDRPLCF